MTDLAATEALLAELIALPSVSSDTNMPVIGLLADRLDRAGARVEVMPDPSGLKGNLWATLGPADAPGGIVLSGHTDVVPVEGQDWHSDPFAMVERDGRLYGRGTCDMKGFIAACVAMAPALAASARRPLHFAFTHDEEVGCIGAQSLTAVLRDRPLPALAILGEPTRMKVIEGHKGCNEYTTRFTGLEGHGSRPELGVNAVEYAVRYVSRLLELKDELKRRAPPDSRFQPPWTTINTGALHGGVAHNVIAGQAQVDWEMRPVARADALHVKAEMAVLERRLLTEMQAVTPQAAIVTEVVGEIAGLAPATRNEARDIALALTGTETGLVAFGTEAGLFQEIGLDCVVCGPGDIAQAHKPDEYLERSELAACLRMLDGLAPRLMRG